MGRLELRTVYKAVLEWECSGLCLVGGKSFSGGGGGVVDDGQASRKPGAHVAKSTRTDLNHTSSHGAGWTSGMQGIWLSARLPIT